MIKVMHVNHDPRPSRAETMLCRIASGMDGTRFENEIVSLTGVLDLAESMEAIGVRVRTLGMKKNAPNPLRVMRLARWIRESKPDIIQTLDVSPRTWSGSAARLAGDVPVVWGIHHTVLDPRIDKRRTMLVSRACAYLSRKIPTRIVCCSEASQRIHKKLGYPTKNWRLSPTASIWRKSNPTLPPRVGA